MPSQLVECFTYDGEEHAASLVEARRIAALGLLADTAVTAALKVAPTPATPATPTSDSVLDNKGRYGSTPLIAACTKGDGLLVTELLLLGADPTLAACHDSIFIDNETGQYDDIDEGSFERRSGSRSTRRTLNEEAVLTARGIALAAIKEAKATKMAADAAVDALGETDTPQRSAAAHATQLQATQQLEVQEDAMGAVRRDMKLLQDFATPLVKAAGRGELLVVRSLIAHVSSTSSKSSLKAFINNVVGKGETALSAAVINGHANVVKLLLETGLADANVTGMASKLQLTSYDHSYIISYDVTDLPLTIACEKKLVDIVAMLLNDPTTNVNGQSIADPNKYHHNQSGCVSSDGHSPLGRMCQYSDKDVSGPWSHPNPTEVVSIDAARKRLEIIKLLLEHPNIDVHAVNDAGATPIQIACTFKAWFSATDVGQALFDELEAIQIEVVQCLFARGADMNGYFKYLPGYYGAEWPGTQGKWSLLHHACTTSNMGMAKFLIKNGADPNGYTEEAPESGRLGVTPLLIVLTNGDSDGACGHGLPTFKQPEALEFLKMLLENGADPHRTGTDMATGADNRPLHAACQWPEGLLALLNHKSPALHDINQVGSVVNWESGAEFAEQYIEDGMDKSVYRDHTPLLIHAQSLTHNNSPHSREKNAFSSANISNYITGIEGSELEGLLKLLSYDGSTGPIDVNQRGGGVEHPLQMMAWLGPCADAYSPFLAVMLVNSKELKVDAWTLTPEDDGMCKSTVLLQKCKFNSHENTPRIKVSDKNNTDVKLLITFGASLKRRERHIDDDDQWTDGKTAIELAEESAGKLLPNGFQYAHDAVPQIKNVNAIQLFKWFKVTAGWSAIEVGAGSRFYIEIYAAVQRGTMNLDDFKHAELKRALSIAKTDPKDKAGWEDAAIPPVCKATVALMHAAVSSFRKGWIPAGHWLFHVGVRTAVHTVVLVSTRLQRNSELAVEDNHKEVSHKDASGKKAAGGAVLPLLPPELWHFILSFLGRDDWKVPPLDAEWVLRLLKCRCKGNFRHPPSRWLL